MRRTALWLLLVGAAVALRTAPHRAAAQTSLQEPVPCKECWAPSGPVSWQWQLQGKIDLSIRAAMYDVDLFDTPKATVRALHRRERRAVCYLDAGTWENWRSDASSFPKWVLGRSNGWPGERWLDIRRRHVLAPIIRARLDRCARKGFDGVEFDNVDAYAN